MIEFQCNNTTDISIHLSEESLSFISSLITRGRFKSVSEVIQSSIRMLEDSETRKQAEKMYVKIMEGELQLTSGTTTAFHCPQELAMWIMYYGEYE
jgi:putative addiction module CopG family antidote